jgi:drug/metabolite transporter (DMT)-like permease
VIFQNLPDGWTWAGAVVIILSGVYVWHRERVRHGLTRRGA